MCANDTRSDIVFVLGKPIRPGTIFPHVIRALETRGSRISVLVPGSGLDITTDLSSANLIVQRGLRRDVLSALERIEERGVRCCNSVARTLALRNRLDMHRKLQAAGLSTPTTTCVPDWGSVHNRAVGNPVVVKALDGTEGRSEGVLVSKHGYLPAVTPFAGPYVLQEYVENSGHIYKAYVAGPAVRGLIKRSGDGRGSDPQPRAFSPDSMLTNLAQRAGAALGLEIYGVDVLMARHGPMIVDVNAFPGFRGVPEAADLVED
jgi:ribosomal protein S6--L-glutamate ligase